ncbi:MAG TPA: PQQ-binding-like beta-propeller repeat protein [Acidimicrobiales bacterium]|nr:PQQ-binding-like beta-propeller repeat protein [Acidimicrobiales bacterium]
MRPQSPRADARRRAAARRRVQRRRRTAVVGALVIVTIVVVVLVTSGGPGGSGGRRGRAAGGSRSARSDLAAHRRAGQIPAVQAGLLPWKLAAPLSRMVVLPAGGHDLVLAGGLEVGGSSASGVYTLDTANGALHPSGSLAHAVHDGAGATIGERDYIFGGGSPATVATVQSFTPGGTGGSGTVTGALPAPRSDDVAVTVGSTAYVVGGYTGTQPDGAVLSTTDGSHFTTAAHLPVPVRYPAVAASGHDVYVFGGDAVGGASAGPTTAIQEVDTADGRARVVGHLPLPLEGATAATLDGHVYLGGGETPTADARAVTTGAGTTQLDGWATAAASSPTAGLTAQGTIWAFQPQGDRLEVAGRLQVPVAYAGAAVVDGRLWLVGGETGPDVLGTAQEVIPDRSFGLAGQPGAGSPYYGAKLLVADRGNDRLLLMNAAMQVTWRYPSPTQPKDPYGFYFPDDAFFMDHGRAIISNQEENETIVEVGYPSGRIVWHYGHPKVPGTAVGYLHEPDDAYLLRNGQITVADADNCRVLVINHNGTVADQIGTNDDCVHDPPHSMTSPNGDTPLWDGDLLVSEITGTFVDEYTTTGKLVWSVHLPISYPSDPQQLDAGPGRNTNRYLIADYSTPGQLLIFTRQGRILYRYDVATGPGALNQPSLAEELPNGVFMINDDYNDRMVAIDAATGALVWQYGITGRKGTAPGMLDTPDGFDLLGPGGTTPTHPQTG